MEETKKRRANVRRKITITSKAVEGLVPAVQDGSSSNAEQEQYEILMEDLKIRVEELQELNLTISEVESEGEYAAGYAAEMDIRVKQRSWTKLLSNVSSSQPSSGSSQAAAVGMLFTDNIKNVPEFNGDRLKYQEFWDSYNHNIHQLPEAIISKSSKFTILRNKLTGEAKQCIEGFSTSDVNYDSAVEHFSKRFGDGEDRKQALWAKLLSLEKVKAESNCIEIRYLLDTTRATLRSLQGLGVDESSYASMVKILIRKRLPTSLDQKWLSSHDCDSASLDTMLDFLESKARIREQAAFLSQLDEPCSKPNQGHQNQGHQNQGHQQQGHQNHGHGARPKQPPPYDRRHQTFFSERFLCQLCKTNDHTIWNCPLATAEKITCVKNQRLCFNCLGDTHMSKDCRSEKRCKYCQGKHHTVICSNGNHDQSKEPSSRGNGSSQSGPFKKAYSSSQPVSGLNILLPVVGAEIKGLESSSKVRILLDSGSSDSYIAADLAESIGSKDLGSINLELFTFGGVKPQLIKSNLVESTLITIEGKEFIIKCYVKDKLGIHQKSPPDHLHCIKELKSVHGQDISDKFDQDVDLLIGQDYLNQVIKSPRIDLSSGAVAVHTIFGWAVQGPTGSFIRNPTSLVGTVMNIVHQPPVEPPTLEERVESFWQLENVPEIQSAASQEFDMFSKSIHFKNGRYEVPLLWKNEDRPTENRESAERLYHCQKFKHEKNNHWRDYCSVMQEYEEFGALEVDPDSDRNLGYFLPHHAVLRQSETHPLRIVMNASQKTKRPGILAMSLNDCLNTGENLLPHVSSVLLNFREKLYPITGDIQKAFFTIAVREEDRKYLRLIWETPKRMCRVPFGVKCSPFLLQATILHHLRESLARGDLSLNTYSELNRSLYMDDIIASFDTEYAMNQFILDSESVFAKAGMNIHKWKSCIPSDINSDSKNSCVLGVNWDRQEDVLFFNPPTITSKINTKRSFLGLLASFFDPLGLCSAIVLYGKIILQQTWATPGLDWDSELPASIQSEVDVWSEGLNSLSNVTFTRCLQLSLPYILHVFVDASNVGIGAMAYAVNTQSTSLICAKTKVAPLSTQTIARLELSATVLGAKLKDFVLASFSRPPEHIYFWSDSKVALAWIKSDSSRQWSTFVANRVAEVLRRTDKNSWNWISGKENPADLCSRGTTNPEQLSTDLYQHGPTWVTNPNNFPLNSDSVEFTTYQELRKSAKVNTSSNVKVDELNCLFSHISHWPKIIRVTALIRRWLLPADERHIQRLKRTSVFRSLEPDIIASDELRNAETSVVKYIQSQYFPELKNLKDQKLISRDSSLRQLDPELSPFGGLLVVGGRLHHADLPYQSRHPIILPYNCRLVELLVRHTHWKLLHGGVEAMITELRRKYWILKAPRMCRDIRTRCVACKRYEGPLPFEPKYANLPADRVNLSRPFSAIGVDYAGPFKVKSKSKGIYDKAYILLFVCAAARAVRYMVVDSQETNDFLLAFRQFAAKNGTPIFIRSDNAKTFKKAKKMLRIEWKFIPPRSPWWGGYYERFVQSLKRPLRKVLGTALVSKDELSCIVAEVETSVNLRPLTHNSVDKDDLEPITPAKLMGMNFTDDSAIELSPGDMNRRQRYLVKIRNSLKKRWQEEYLTGLQKINNSYRENKTLKIGDIVLIQTDNKTRSQWPLARILELAPGPDRIVRVVKVLMNGSELYRPIQRILPLETEVNLNRDLVDTTSDDNQNEIVEPVDKPSRVKASDSDLSVKAKTKDTGPSIKVTSKGRTVKPRVVLDI